MQPHDSVTACDKIVPHMAAPRAGALSLGSVRRYLRRRRLPNVFFLIASATSRHTGNPPGHLNVTIPSRLGRLRSPISGHDSEYRVSIHFLDLRTRLSSLPVTPSPRLLVLQELLPTSNPYSWLRAALVRPYKFAAFCIGILGHQTVVGTARRCRQ